MFKSKLFVGLLGTLLLVSACKKDDDNDGANNSGDFPQELVLDGTRHGLGTAFMEFYPDYGVNSHNLDLILLSDGLTAHYDADNYPDSISGNGYMMYFEMFSADSTFLSAGTYSMDTTLTVNTFQGAFVAPVSNGEINGSPEQLKTGSVEVSRSNNVYTITGSGKDADNKDFEFSYQAAITIY